MKQKKIIHYFKKLEQKLKKIKSKKSRLAVLASIVGGILLIFLLGFGFKILIEKERLEIKKEPERNLWQPERRTEPVLPERAERVSPEILFRLRKSGIERYFLSEVELINLHYTAKIHTCLYERGRPIYPPYVYDTWALVNYPEEPFPQIILIRYLLLPEDNPDFRPDKNCFIKEIKTEKDWQELKEKYGFSKEQF